MPTQRAATILTWHARGIKDASREEKYYREGRVISPADSSVREEWIARRRDRERIRPRVKRRAYLRSRCACRCRGT